MRTKNGIGWKLKKSERRRDKFRKIIFWPSIVLIITGILIPGTAFLSALGVFLLFLLFLGRMISLIGIIALIYIWLDKEYNEYLNSNFNTIALVLIVIIVVGFFFGEKLNRHEEYELLPGFNRCDRCMGYGEVYRYPNSTYPEVCNICSGNGAVKKNS